MADQPSKRLRTNGKTAGSRSSAAKNSDSATSSSFCENSAHCRDDNSMSRNEVKSKQATLDRYWSKKPESKIETTSMPKTDENAVVQVGSETLEYESSLAQNVEVDWSQASSDDVLLDTVPETPPDVLAADTNAVPLVNDESYSAAASESSATDNLSTAVSDDSSPKHLELGTSFDELIAACENCRDLPPLCPSASHTVLFVPDTADEQCIRIPKPSPSDVNLEEARWDNHHVRLPYSPQNKLLVNSIVVSRWEKIVSSLSAAEWNSSHDIEKAILSYNKYKWDFMELHRYFEGLTEEEHDLFFSQTLPKMAELAMSLPSVCTQAIPLLRKQNAGSISMSQQQAACLLANAFFCTFPSRNTNFGSDDSIPRLPPINFNSLYRRASPRSCHARHAKLNCLLHYFSRVTTSMPRGTMTFRRQVLESSPDWANSTAQLQKLLVTANGTIEDNGTGMLQVDFANKFVGGGVLEDGCVQEEIRFVIAPELIVSRLITEELDPNESLLITGCERFSNYSGYGRSTHWLSDHRDSNTRDSWGRLGTEIVAIDAKVCRNLSSQLLDHALLRELNKAYCGFCCESDARCPVATGNWGCGAFGGDLRLKALLQLMAAAEANRPICYFTFGDDTLCREMFQVWESASSARCTIGKLWTYILEAAEQLHTKKGGDSSYIYHYIIDRCRLSLDNDG